VWIVSLAADRDSGLADGCGSIRIGVTIGVIDRKEGGVIYISVGTLALILLIVLLVVLL
jgi:hypothetical protein